MSTGQKHIVSRFSWHTAFDAKEKAVELQDRLLRWSRINMPGEINEVFDGICPREQTWRIQNLELDLGDIDYTDLEAGLSLRLREKLSEKLVELVVNMSRNNGNLEILDEQESQVDMLRSFLVSGTMPWNYKPEYGTVNELVARQLLQNKPELVVMLRETGSTHENVRKRMAWQLSEQNITHIIEGLEPNHHGHIIEFSNELTQIQTKKVIVQTGVRDFRKALWFWVFNHLLTERGTIFNKVAFMKSSLRQMADHYNIGYAELLSLIEEVMARLPQYQNIKSDFMLALRMVAAHEQVLSGSIQEAGSTGEAWQSLETFFQDKPGRKDPGFSLSELVLNLGIKDKARLGKILLGQKLDEKQWIKALGRMKREAAESIFYALNPSAAPLVLNGINLLNEAGAAGNRTTRRKQLWYAGILYLQRHHNTSFNNRHFISEMVKWICTRETSYGRDAFVSPVFRHTPAEKTDARAKAEISMCLYQGLSQHDPGFIQEILNRIPAYVPAGNGTYINDEKSEALIRLFLVDPDKTLDWLQQHSQKEQTLCVLERIHSSGFSERVIKKMKYPACVAMVSLVKYLQDHLPEDKTGILFSGEWRFRILRIILLNPSSKPEALLAELVLEIIPGFTAQKQPAVLYAFEQWVAQKQLPFISKAKVERTIKQMEHGLGLPLMKRVWLIIRTSSLRQEMLCDLLVRHYKDASFEQARKDAAVGKKIVAYVLPAAEGLLARLPQEYCTAFAPQLASISALKIKDALTRLFWQCLLDYKNHRGRLNVFLKQYNTAAMMYLQQRVKKQQDEISLTSFSSDSERFGTETLKAALEQAIKDAQDKVNIDGCIFELQKLWLMVWERDAQIPARVLRTIIPTSKRLANLCGSIGFTGFITGLFSSAYASVHKNAQALQQLWQLTVGFDNALALNLQAKFFTFTWKGMQNGKFVPAESRAFILQILSAIQVHDPERARIYFSSVHEQVAMNEVLRSAVKQYFPRLSHYEPGKLNYFTAVAKAGLLDELCSYLIGHRQLPPWFIHNAKTGAEEVLNELLAVYPARILAVLRKHPPRTGTIQWMYECMGMRGLVAAIGHLHQNDLQHWLMMEKFHRSFDGIKLDGINAREIQMLIFEKVLLNWIRQDHKPVCIDQLWNELVWETCVKRHLDKKVFVREMEQIRLSFPLALQVTFERFSKQVKAPAKPKPGNIPLPLALKKNSGISLHSKEPKAGIRVRNAGIVIINSYVQRLFQLLNLTDGKKFSDARSQVDAIHFLQYLATGLKQTDECDLVLNKVMCGLSPAHPVDNGIEISEKQEELINSLLKAAIGHWPTAGHTTVNGFRGNWLIREGMLMEQDDRWELVVEKRPYDMLINKSPFSFSFIRYPWMSKPLNVTWPY